MSVLRICFLFILVCAGLALFFSLLILLLKFAPRLLGLLVAWSVCGLGVWNAIRCIRSGGAGGGKSYQFYERVSSPFHFWCNVALHCFIGIFGFTVGVCFIFVRF
jgi:hypothetical protein